MNKYLYFIKDLKVETWIKWWLVRKGSITIDYVLGELTSGTDITINNTVEKTFYKFDIKGNSVQDGTPTPETEVPILSVGDNGSISEKIVNKNLFNKNDTSKILYTYIGSSTNAISSQGSATSKFRTVFIKCKPNTTYYLKKFTTYNIIRIGESTSNNAPTYGTQLSDVVAPSSTKASYTTSSNAKWLVAQISSTLDEEETQIVVDNFMICYGNTEPTTYTAHAEQTYTIPVQQPMRSIGTVRDEFIQVNGNWFERHNIKSIIFNGSEGWTSTGTQYTGLYSAYVILSDMKRQNVFSGDLLSNYFIEKGFSVQEEGMTKSLQPLDFDFLILRISTDKASTAQELKTWLSTHNTEVLYLLATPVDLPCTEEQISILENLPKSYNEQTNIYSLDVTPAYVEAQSYVKKEGE